MGSVYSRFFGTIVCRVKPRLRLLGEKTRITPDFKSTAKCCNYFQLVHLPCCTLEASNLKGLSCNWYIRIFMHLWCYFILHKSFLNCLLIDRCRTGCYFQMAKLRSDSAEAQQIEEKKTEAVELESKLSENVSSLEQQVFFVISKIFHDPYKLYFRP